MAQTAPREGEGWLLYSAVILGIMGIVRIFDGLWAFKYDDDFPQIQTILFEKDLATYGWIWIILGVLLLVAAFGIVARNQFARWFGVLVASLSAIGAMTWIPYQPVWAFVHVTLAVLVIWGLLVHGER